MYLLILPDERERKKKNQKNHMQKKRVPLSAFHVFSAV